jgi:hypothetical protein
MSALRHSVPGQPPRLIPETDPYLGLTPRTRYILDQLRGHNGNRSRTARTLGLTVQTVQRAAKLGREAGVMVPEGHRRGPDLAPRVGTPEALCGAWMPQSGVHCPMGAGHRSHHCSRKRAA